MSDTAVPPSGAPFRQTWSRRWRTGAFIALMVLVAVTFARWALAPSGGPGGAVFRTAEVERRPLVKTVEATGRLDARERLVVTAGLKSRLVKVMVNVGDTVAEGQTLAELDASPAEHDLREAEGAVASAGGARTQAQVALDEAEKRLSRAQRLRKKDQASAMELEKAEAALAQAKAGLRIAAAKLSQASAHRESARAARERATVLAPRAGVVLSAPEELGVSVGPEGRPLFILAAPLSTLQLDARVSEADIGLLAAGQPSDFTVQAFPRERFPAQVELIGLVAEARQGVATYPVNLTVPNPDGRLRPGMSASVRFEVQRVEEALVVRDAALRFQPPGEPQAPRRSRVYVVEGNRLRAVDVEVGVSAAAFVEVRPKEVGRLKPGDRLAIGLMQAGDRRSAPGVSLGGGG